MKLNAQRPNSRRLPLPIVALVISLCLLAAIFALYRLVYAAAGSLDTSFDTDGKLTTDIGSSTTDTSRAIAIQSDGKLVVVGGNGSDFALARYNTDGSLDTSFGTNGKVTTDFSEIDQARAVAIQSDGKIVVAGCSNCTHDGSQEFALARYHGLSDTGTPGTLDTSFDTDGKVTTSISSFTVANAVAIQSDGKIVVVGCTDYWGGMDEFVYCGAFALARYHGLSTTGTPGSLDTTFDTDGKVTTEFSDSSKAYAVAIQSGGKIVVAGCTQTSWSSPITADCGNSKDFALVRYTTSGSLDTDFDTDGKLTTDIGSSTADFARAVAIDSDGKIVVAGTSANDFAVVRYSSTGSLDTSFSTDGKQTTDIGSSTTDAGNAMAIDSDGKIVVAGTSANDFAVARYNTDGSLDTTFSTDGKVTTDIGSSTADAGNAMAIQSDKKIVVAGTSANDFAVARYLVATAQTPSDTATLAESIAKALGFRRSDGASLMGSVLLGFPRSDGATLTEGIAKALGFRRSDGASLTDSIAKAMGFGRSDGASLTDSIAKALGFRRSDSAALTESLQKTLNISRSDAASLAASMLLGIPRSDGATLTESIAKVLGFRRSDSASLTDSTAKALGIPRSETLALTESLQKTLNISRSDAAALAAALVVNARLSRQDTASLVATVLLGFPRSDGASLTDSIAKALGFRRSDSASLTDSTAKALGIPRSETLALTESLQKTLNISRSDAAALAAVLVMNARLSRQDTASLVATMLLGIPRSDGASLTDSTAKALGIRRSDGASLSDSTAKALGFTRSDGVAVVEARQLQLGVPRAEAMGIGETLSFQVTQRFLTSPTLSQATAPVVTGAPTVVETPDKTAKVVVPSGAKPASLAGDKLEIRVERRNTQVVSMPAPAPDSAVAAAFEVTALVNGTPASVTFAAPVELFLPLSGDLLRTVGGASNLKVVRLVGGNWIEVPAEYQGGSPPAPAGFMGQLRVVTTGFSLYAIHIRLPEAAPVPVSAPEPTPTPTPTPTRTPVPTPTLAPTATPTPTPTAIPTPTATATPVATATVVLAPTATPTPTSVPMPTATASPTATPTPTAVPMPTATAIPVATAVPTRTPTPTPMAALSPTATPTATPVAVAAGAPPAAAGILVGVGVVLGLLILLVLLWMRRRRRGAGAA